MAATLMHRAMIACCVGCIILGGQGCAWRGKTKADAGPQASSDAAANAAQAAAVQAAKEQAARAGELKTMMGELQALGALDPQALDQLLKDLQQTDPALWPQVMQVFRTSVAYRQRMLAKQASKAAQKKAAAEAAAAAAEENNVATAADPAATPPLGGRQPAPLDGTLSVAQSTSANAAATSAGSANSGASSAASLAAGKSAAAGEKSAGTTGDADAVRQVSYEQPLSGDPKQMLSKAIQTLEAAPPDEDPSAQAARQVYLRMLYLAAGRRDDAVRPIEGLPASEQQFWSEQLFGLATYLDASRSPDAKRRAAEARLHLTHATGQLSETGDLLVRNLAFCTEVHSFGVFTPFPKHEFKPNQQVILYAEVENFKSEETPKGFHTALKSSYQILDQQGRRVVQHDLGMTEEYCRNARRDYFIRYFLSIPARIYDGPYSLHLTIEDTLGRKIGQSTIDFTAKEK